MGAGFMRAADNFWTMWLESGLWLLAVALTGLVSAFAFFYILLHSFHFLKRVVVVQDSAGEKKVFETQMLQLSCLLFTALVVFLVWKKLQEAKDRRRFQNKGMFGVKRSQPNGIRQISVEQYAQEMLEATENGKKQLFESEEYKAALRRKGYEQANWNWQTREKELARRDQVMN